jgi:cell division protein FtsI/penicillin-binding protein 2
MGAISRLTLCVLSSLLLLPALLARGGTWVEDRQSPGNLYYQALIHALNQEFAGDGDSYLLLDANSGTLLASHWSNYSSPISLGSLVKPFTALAYAETHDFVFPTYECKGQASACWQVHPHGSLNIVSAISASCNSYFRTLAGNVSTPQMQSVTHEFGLQAPGKNFTVSSLVGLGGEWKISPIRMAHAYGELWERRTQPGVREIIEGMSRSAHHGTGAAVGRQIKYSEVLVKTGTVPCSHAAQTSTDGFAVVLLPVQNSAIVLLIRVHGVAGVKAAEVAARVLRQSEE